MVFKVILHLDMCQNILASLNDFTGKQVLYISSWTWIGMMFIYMLGLYVLWRHFLTKSLSINRSFKPGGRFKNAYELLTLRALKISMFHKRFIFQCMGKIFCVEFQRYPLKFHTKYLTHTLKDMTYIQHWNFKMHFHEWKALYCDSNCTDSCF